MSTAMAVTEAGTALDIEQLEVAPTSTGQAAAASVVVAHHARDKDDLGLLLEALGLPTDDDALTALLPHLPAPPTETGDTMMTTPPNAFEAMAISMHSNGSTFEEIHQATGVSADELQALLDREPADPFPAPADATPSLAPADAVTPAPVGPAAQIEELLAWAERHDLAGIRSRAARIRTDLTELTERRDSEKAVGEAEARVAKLKAELEAAQADLRQVKTGGRPAVTAPASKTPATAPTPIAKRGKEELASIRKWARDNGHQVADRGLPPRHLIEAYEAARSTPQALAEAS